LYKKISISSNTFVSVIKAIIKLKNQKYSQIVIITERITALVICCLLLYLNQAQHNAEVEYSNSTWKTFERTNQQSVIELASTKPTLFQSQNSNLKLIDTRELTIKHTVAEQCLWQYQSSSNNSLQGSKFTSYASRSLVIVGPRFTHYFTDYRPVNKLQIFTIEPFLKNEVYVDAYNGHKKWLI